MTHPRKRRSVAFGLFMAALMLVLALGVWLLVIGLTTPPFATPGYTHM